MVADTGAQDGLAAEGVHRHDLLGAGVVPRRDAGLVGRGHWYVGVLVAEQLACAVVPDVDDPAVVVAVHGPVADPGHVADVLDGQDDVVEVELAVRPPGHRSRRVLLQGERRRW